jgi:hypothetical protein
MPRKQRFKPSRKPKPIPQSEAATIGHDGRNLSSHPGPLNENVEIPGVSERRPDQDPGVEPEPDPRLR